jgi:hypothetical protein
VNHEDIWAQKGRKYLPHTRKQTCTYCEPFGISAIFKEKGIFTRQADRDKPMYLGTAHVVNIRLNTMRAEFDTKTIHIEVMVEQLILGQVLIRELRIWLQYCLNIHKPNRCRKILQMFLLIYKEISEKPNTYKLQTTKRTQSTAF